MADEKKVQQYHYKIPVSEKNHRFLMRLSVLTQSRLTRAVRGCLMDYLDRIKEGKSI